MEMKFEFDASKSMLNKRKHGIDFIEAQDLWKDDDRIEIPAKTEDEMRLMVIGRIKTKLWSVIITYRKNNIRIISCRRARVEERELYES
jgi:uncharacterized DUF497 family protein